MTDYTAEDTAELEALRLSIMDEIRRHSNAIEALNGKYMTITTVLVKRWKDEREAADREGVEA